MSDDWLTVIPTDPTWVPPPALERTLADVVTDLAPDAESISVSSTDHVAFIDAGSNFTSTRCPRCSAEVDSGWWTTQMSEAAADDFSDLRVVLPCCNAPTTLNDLMYDWPQGFARWRVEVFNPCRGLLHDAEVEALRTALGHDVRVIWTHI